MSAADQTSSDAQILLARINELAERSLREQQPQWTDFLDPAEREEAEASLKWITGVRFNSFGGYSQAERRRLVIYPDYYLVEIIQPQLAFLEIKPTQSNLLAHRDYLGAVLALGIKRSKIGDLLVSETAGQLAIVPDLAEFIAVNLVSVGADRVKVSPIDPEQLNLPNRREKEIRTTVASLRLDALAALGFGESRAKMAREIKAERVKVNWKPTKSPDLSLKSGDIISIRGRGRVEFRETTGHSKKGRIGILLVRLY